MSYAVHELYYTLQGEGAQSGRPAVFLRFAGCNLWSGRERHRAGAVCRFCDTEFVGIGGAGGGRFRKPSALAEAVAAHWPARAEPARRYVVCTGGEPLLQLDDALIAALHERGFEVGVETNGTRAAPAGVDWLCVSPKADAGLVQRQGDELKLVYPQREAEAQPERFTGLEFRHFFLQPLDDEHRAENTARAAEYCLAHPEWRLSLQMHKLAGLP